MFSWMHKIFKYTKQSKTTRPAAPDVFIFQKNSFPKNEEPTGILNIEVDHVLFDWDESYDSEAIKLFHAEELREQLRFAYENNILVVISSMRDYLQDLSHAFSVENILSKLSEQTHLPYFHFIYYTNETPVSTILSNQLRRYFDGNESESKRIAYIKSKETALMNCNKYCVIEADVNDKKYLTQIERFSLFCLELKNQGKYSLDKSRLDTILDNYAHYKNGYCGLRWFFTSNESKAAMRSLQNAQDDIERYQLAMNYINKNPNKAFSKEIRKAIL